MCVVSRVVSCAVCDMHCVCFVCCALHRECVCVILCVMIVCFAMFLRAATARSSSCSCSFSSHSTVCSVLVFCMRAWQNDSNTYSTSAKQDAYPKPRYSFAAVVVGAVAAVVAVGLFVAVHDVLSYLLLVLCCSFIDAHSYLLICAVVRDVCVVCAAVVHSVCLSSLRLKACMEGQANRSTVALVPCRNSPGDLMYVCTFVRLYVCTFVRLLLLSLFVFRACSNQTTRVHESRQQQHTYTHTRTHTQDEDGKLLTIQPLPQSKPTNKPIAVGPPQVEESSGGVSDEELADDDESEPEQLYQKWRKGALLFLCCYAAVLCVLPCCVAVLSCLCCCVVVLPSHSSIAHPFINQ